MDTFSVVGAFKRTFVSKDPVEFEFLADGGLILADVLSDSILGGTIGDTGEDNAAFIKSQMRISIIFCIIRHIPCS
nr:hypothetical protein [Eisenbergiella porci]